MYGKERGVQKVTDFRITFSKTGPLVFISHLDLTHTVVRAFGRAGIRIRHSTGFNPHPKLVFALPLSVGMAGEREMFDVSLEADIDADELEKRLREVFPPQLEILSVELPDKKFREVKSAHYRYTVFCDAPAEKVTEYLSSESLVVTKKSKSGEKQVDIKPQIFSYSAQNIDGSLVLYLETDSAPDSYLNPDYVVRALCDGGILPQGVPYESVRTRIVIK